METALSRTHCEEDDEVIILRTRVKMMEIGEGSLVRNEQQGILCSRVVPYMISKAVLIGGRYAPAAVPPERPKR